MTPPPDFAETIDPEGTGGGGDDTSPAGPTPRPRDDPPRERERQRDRRRIQDADERRRRARGAQALDAATRALQQRDEVRLRETGRRNETARDRAPGDDTGRPPSDGARGTPRADAMAQGRPGFERRIGGGDTRQTDAQAEARAEDVATAAGDTPFVERPGGVRPGARPTGPAASGRGAIEPRSGGTRDAVDDPGEQARLARLEAKADDIAFVNEATPPSEADTGRPPEVGPRLEAPDRNGTTVAEFVDDIADEGIAEDLVRGGVLSETQERDLRRSSRRFGAAVDRAAKRTSLFAALSAPGQFLVSEDPTLPSEGRADQPGTQAAAGAAKIADPFALGQQIETGIELIESAPAAAIEDPAATGATVGVLGGRLAGRVGRGAARNPFETAGGIGAGVATGRVAGPRIISSARRGTGALNDIGGTAGRRLGAFRRDIRGQQDLTGPGARDLDALPDEIQGTRPVPGRTPESGVESGGRASNRPSKFGARGGGRTGARRGRGGGPARDAETTFGEGETPSMLRTIQAKRGELPPEATAPTTDLRQVIDDPATVSGARAGAAGGQAAGVVEGAVTRRRRAERFGVVVEDPDLSGGFVDPATLATEETVSRVTAAQQPTVPDMDPRAIVEPRGAAIGDVTGVRTGVGPGEGLLSRPAVGPDIDERVGQVPAVKPTPITGTTTATTPVTETPTDTAGVTTTPTAGGGETTPTPGIRPPPPGPIGGGGGGGARRRDPDIDIPDVELAAGGEDSVRDPFDEEFLTFANPIADRPFEQLDAQVEEGFDVV